MSTWRSGESLRNTAAEQQSIAIRIASSDTTGEAAEASGDPIRWYRPGVGTGSTCGGQGGVA